MITPKMKIRQALDRRPTVAVLPRLRSYSWQDFLTAEQRFWVAVVLAAIGCVAVIAYIVAVNSMLLSGEAINKGRITLKTLERERAALESVAAVRQSPSWLEKRSEEGGMVAADGVRYLTEEQSVALSR